MHYGNGRKYSALIFFAAVVLAVNCCTPKLRQEECITIGALLPLTGNSSDEGLRALNGLQLAKKEINEAGGILGKKLDIIVLNDRGDEEFIVQQYNALKEKGVIAIIGSSYSNVTLAIAKAAEKDGMPLISPTASNPDVTKGRKYVFSAVFIDDYQAEALAEFARSSLNAKTAVVMYSSRYYGFKSMTETFAKLFEDGGGRVMGVEMYSAGDDFADVLKKYAVNPPDVIFCPEAYTSAAKLVNTAYEIGLDKTYILGTDAWDGFISYVQYHEAMKNIYYSTPFSFDDNDPVVTEFAKKYLSAFSQLPLTGSAAAYTSVYILSKAIEKAGNTDSKEIVSAIRTNEFDTITGRIKYEENNNPRANVYIIQIKDGVYSTYQKLNLQQR